MIRFVCTCGHRFEVDDDQAGNSLQCPRCRLLVDVPTTSEMGGFTEDGLYRMGDAPAPLQDSHRLAELELVFSKTKLDAEGNEIDLRTLPAGKPICRGGPGAPDDPTDDETGELDLAPREARVPDITARPKYDPETGELIRPLDLRKDPERDVDPASIPMAKATIAYAGVDLSKRISPLRVALELFMPMNIVVMFFIFITHVFGGMMFLVGNFGMLFVAAAWFILQALIFAHYGNVVDDTGRNDQDDLPRPLRNIDFFDDIWQPFYQTFGGLMISYGVPTLVLGGIAQRLGAPGWLSILIGLAVGTIVAPAVLLTMLTSGSAMNLRPDRVLHVMRICGWHYVAVTALWAIAFPIYALGWLGTCAAMVNTFGMGGGMPIGSWGIAMPTLLLGIYLAHYFCWYLGLLWKAHHEQFPWVLQRYYREPDKDRNRKTHANQLGRTRRPSAGHLLPPGTQAPTQRPPGR